MGVSAVGGFAILQTRRSPSDVCVANISDFCFDEDACQASITIGEGARVDVRVCKIVKLGCRLTIMIDPFMNLYLNKLMSSALLYSTYPIAYTRQSAAGAIAVMGSNMVRADICSDVEGSKMMTVPCDVPAMRLA